jgi:hypothetical protein
MRLLRKEETADLPQQHLCTIAKGGGRGRVGRKSERKEGE